MSQVRKFSNGGGTAAQTEQQSSTEAIKKKYKLIVNGKEMLLDDDSLAQFRKAGSGQGGMMGNVYADIADALQAGNTVRYNSDSNTIFGVDFKRIDPEALAKARENQIWDKKAQRRANRYARKNNLTHQFNSALATLGNINFQKRSEETPESSESSKLSLFGSYNPFDYNTDDQGNTTFASSPWNATAKKYIDAYADLTKLSREQAKEKYDFDDEKYDQFMNWYNTYGNVNGQDYNWSGEGDSLWSRIQSKNYNENDDELLKLLGWDITKKSDRSYEGSGFNNDALERAGYYVLKDSNGNPILYDENRQVVRDNIYLKNFDWAKDSNWKNGAWFQGRFYTNDELFNQDNDANRAFQSFVNASSVRDENGNWNPELYYDALKKSNWIYQGMNDSNPFSLYQDSNKTLLPGFEHIVNPYYFQDISQEYTTPKGTTIIRYIDPTSQDREQDGTPLVKFAVSDDPNAIFNTQEELQTYLSSLSNPISRVTGVRTPRTTFQPEYESDKSQRYTKSNVGVKVKNDNNMTTTESVYRGDDGNYYFKGKNGKFYQIYGQKLLDRITRGDVITQNEFEKGRDESDERTGWGKFWHWSPWGYTDVSDNAVLYKPNQYDTLLGYKKGGKITKFQFGGDFSRVTNTVSQGVGKDREIGKLHKIGGGPGLTDGSDKWATAATALDTTSLGTSFIPGVGNVVGALTGLGGSVSRFVSDIKRDGFDAGDLGRFGINLGLDALTLIPFAGSAAKAAKLAKTGKATVKAAKNTTKVAKAADKTKDILSSSDVLGNIAAIGKFFKPGEKMWKVGRAAEIALPAVGTVSGINAAIDAAKDGEITTDEMASIASGIMSGALLGRGVSRALDRKALKTLQNKIGIKSNVPEYKATFKNKDGADITVTLTKDDLTSLKGKRKKALIETLESKVKNAGGDLEKTGIKAEDLLDRFKLPMKDGVVSGINKNWNKLNIPKEKKLDVFSTEALSNKELAKTLQNKNLGYWGNRAARAYQYGLSRNAEALNAIQRLTGKTLIAIPRTTFGGWGTNWVNGRKPKKISTSPKSIISTPSSTASSSTKINTSSTTVTPEFKTKQNLIRDIRRVHSSYDLRQLLYKINTNMTKEYESILKKNPYLRDEIIKHINNDRWFHGNGIDEFIKKYNIKFKKGGKIVKAQPGTKMPFGTFVTDTSSKDPNLFDYQKSGIQFNGDVVDWTKTYGAGKFNNLRNIYLNNWDNQKFKSIKDAYLAQLSQGNSDVDLSNFTKDDFLRLTQDRKLGYAHNLWTDAYQNWINEENKKRRDAITQSYFKPQIEEELIVEESLPEGAPIPEELSKELGDGSNTGKTKQKRRFNWDPDTFIGLANLGYSIHKNNQMYGVLDDAIRKSGRALQKQMPTEIYDRYQDHITPIYQEAANAKRQFTPTSTDAVLNYTMRQVNEDAAQQLLTEGRLKASEAYSQYLDKDLAARRAYADQRRGVADQNRAIMASTVMQLGQNDAARRLANNQSVQNYIMEFRNKLAQDRQRLKGFQLQDAQVQAQNEYNRIFNEAGNSKMNEFNNLSEDEKQMYGGDWMYYWQSKDITGYNNALNEATTASQNIMRNFYPSQLDFFRYRPTQLVNPTSPTTTVNYKKGGKTPKYIQRHNGPKPDEAIWIQRNKDTAKALEKLHDAVIKLFMKTLS